MERVGEWLRPDRVVAASFAFLTHSLTHSLTYSLIRSLSLTRGRTDCCLLFEAFIARSFGGRWLVESECWLVGVLVGWSVGWLVGWLECRFASLRFGSVRWLVRSFGRSVVRSLEVWLVLSCCCRVPAIAVTVASFGVVALSCSHVAFPIGEQVDLSWRRDRILPSNQLGCAIFACIVFF